MNSPKNTVTSKDVAKLAGVSQSTVSRVFIPGSSVSEKTKQKVFEAAKALNYRPNAFARSLTTNESRLIGLVFPDADYPIHMKTLQLISSELQKQGYSTVLIPWQVDEKDNHSIPNIFQYRVDGVIAASATFNKTLYEECEEFNIPVVQYARVVEGTRSSYVISDNYEAGQQAAQLLHKTGVTSAVYLTGEVPTFTNVERKNGFIAEFEELAGQTPRVVEASYDYTSSLDTIRELLQTSQRPEAVFCATDNLAMAVMDVARLECGLDIPDDLQVIGFDNIPQTEWLSYQLTTFRQDFKRLARESVKIIVDQICNQNSSLVKMMVPVKLIERKTTKV
ncbi:MULTISPECIES: LacI family DNA-binding transcriptional regulator [Photobacterium]|uniref:LacI family transcriptional regulator n=1 Tax=Photobacterium ganghwense TaxID=320778 RepID=A0A0J1H9P9_9GAMM|nr:MULTISPECIES: LacI family DNA-binding transcriptional regulator [Photobacterium]KLV08411.1 LacI family transcriptional regulator [Photobacterium ganghwense]MBV1840534.1 LacI family DNA-binding transcriptional regulator [Photobacterium ganghwense]PSU07549.1 LacI family DNA-binding transcriptional regulator [Photobacterium ganghwense]QSV16282.1 LacI family DNA-binding transcriptional regulator [Photobacterium ganghwense]